MRIGIVVDSCCDLPKDFIDANAIVVMPITLRIGDLEIEDRRDPGEISVHLRQLGDLTHTCMVPADRIRRGLAVPHVCISYGGALDVVFRLPGYSVLAEAARETGVDVLLSPMSKTAAVNVGPGAMTLAFAASGQPLH